MDVISITTYLPIIYSLLLVFIAMLIAAYYYVETSRGVRLIKKLPGPPGIPILGHPLTLVGNSPDEIIPKLEKYQNKYGTIAGAYFGTRTFVFMTEPRDIEIILSSSVHIEKPMEYRFFKPWLGDGLLITTGDKWRRHRKIIAPTFHISILKSFVSLFYENSVDLVRRLRDEIGKEFDCHDYLSAVTVDILTETVMGVKRERRQNTGHEYAAAVMKMCDIIHRRTYDLPHLEIFFKYMGMAKLQERLLNTIHTSTNYIIKEKTRDMEESPAKHRRQQISSSTNKTNAAGKVKNSDNDNYMNFHYVADDLDFIDENDVGEKKRTAFLETMINLKKNSGQLTDEEIWEEVNTIMFEGHDTVAAASSFVLCILGYHQNIQNRVYEELDAIFGDSDRQCSFQDTVEMKYLERVIFETLRLFPPVPAIARNLEEDVKIRNYVLPKNSTIVIFPYGTHRLKDYYPNPEVFNPDNFLPEKIQQRHYYAFIPFSGGPRSCVGRKYAILNLKVLLSTILRNYRIISDMTDKDFPVKGDIILKRSDGFKISIEPRKPI